MHEMSWTRDTTAQFIEMLLGDNPDPLDTLCIHAYEADDIARMGSATEAARTSGKPLFVGEFGVPGGDTPEARENLAKQLDALLAHKVPLAAIWVYDYTGQDKVWNITTANERAWQLQMAAEKNRAMQSAAKAR
jgi:hypothetical protein